MVDIFDEVAEDLRTERAAKLARRYGGAVIGLAVLVLAAVAAQQGWEWYQGQQNTKAATAYLALTNQIADAGDGITNARRISFAQAEQNFAASAPETYRILAGLQAAALYANAGQMQEALAQWNAVGEDPHADPLLANAANLLWVQHALGNVPDAEVAVRLAPLTLETNPFHGLAQEVQALMYMSEGKTDLAKAVLAQIASDPGSPQGVTNRAQILLAQLNGQ